MPDFCSIVGCHNKRSKLKDLGFYRIPKVVTGEGQATEDLTRKRRLAWLKAINRKDLGDKEATNKPWLRVCGEHFVSGKPSYIQEFNSPGWAPTLKLGYTKSAKSGSCAYARLQARRGEKRKHENQAVQNVFSEEEEQSTPPELHEAKNDRSGEDIVEDVTVSRHKSSQTDMTMHFVSTMESELHTLSTDLIMAKSQLENCVYDEKYFEINEEKVKNYTGLPTFALLREIYLYIEPGMNQTARSRLSKFQEMLIVLFKLKLSIPFQVLGDMFNIHQSTASNIFLKVLEVMYINLSDLIHWPERDFIKETMPMEFIKEFGRKVTVIIDCFEIFIERPSSVKAQAQTYSSYKHHNTIKYLIGITPQGVVSFFIFRMGWENQ